MATKWLDSILELFKGLFSRRSGRATVEWETVGPSADEHPIIRITDVLEVVPKVNVGELSKGWWSLAKRTPMHPGRIGRSIIPQTLIVHTTDMLPGTFNALVKAWQAAPGKGNGAHFLIGKDEKDGVVQFASILSNANHAGGPNCGGIKLPTGAIVHPNVCSVGVELDNAGKLKKVGDKWMYEKRQIPTDQVYVDPQGRGWEKVTPYQMDMLKRLYAVLKPVFRPWPAGTKVAPNGSYSTNGSPWAEVTNPTLIGHASTNPVNKSDPGEYVMTEIKKWL